jgi:hypothetical protein
MLAVPHLEATEEGSARALSEATLAPRSSPFEAPNGGVYWPEFQAQNDWKRQKKGVFIALAEGNYWARLVSY